MKVSLLPTYLNLINNQTKKNYFLLFIGALPAVSALGAIKPKWGKNYSNVEYVCLLAGCFVLTINAGFINGVTLRSINPQTVSSTTGAISAMGSYMVLNDWEETQVRFLLILGFSIGAAITGYFIPSDNFSLNNSYLPVLIMEIVFICIALGIEVSYPDNDYFIYICAGICGLQNGMTTGYSGTIIRTTHMTGIHTDLGYELGKLVKGQCKDPAKFIYFFVIIGGYFLGAVCAGLIFPYWDREALIFSAIIYSLFIVCYVLVVFL
jgi:uncharacterized membrane protein YoaK (UPF0700 family)